MLDIKKKYIGVRSNRQGGRISYRVRFMHKGKEYNWGGFKTQKEAAKSHDIFVLTKGLDRKTNFIKKKLVD